MREEIKDKDDSSEKNIFRKLNVYEGISNSIILIAMMILAIAIPPDSGGYVPCLVILLVILYINTIALTMKGWSDYNKAERKNAS